MNAVGSSRNADAFENPAQRVGRTQELVDIILKFYIASQSGAWQNRQPLRRILAAICRSNRVFYYATVDQLWSDMDSFLPCTVLLPLCGGDSSPEILDHAHSWDRFAFYTSKITALSIRPDTQQNGTWISFLVGHPSCPKSLFPRLKTLRLYSIDAGSLAILAQVAPQLTECVIHNPKIKEDSLSGVTTALGLLYLKTELSLSLELLEALQQSITSIRCLCSLSIILSPGPLCFHGRPISFINRIDGLKRLNLSFEKAKPCRVYSDLIGGLPIQQALQHAPELPNLESLAISGDGTILHGVAMHAIYPCGLRRLDIDFLLTDYRRIFLIPHALRVFLQRNPRMQHLTVKRSPVSSRTLMEIRDSDLSLMINSPTMQHTEQFLAQLVRASALNTLIIENVPFLDTDIILKIWNILPNLPNLYQLTLRPLPLTTSLNSEYALVIPQPRILEEIAVKSPQLRLLTIPVDVTRVPSPPTPVDLNKNHRLLFLDIASGPRPSSPTMRQYIAIARFLDALFPKATILSLDLVGTGHEEARFWESVYDLVRSYRESRFGIVAAT